METAHLTASYEGIQNTAFFSDNHFSELRKVMEEKVFYKGETLYLEGDSADRLYFMDKGAVHLTMTLDDGKELLLHCFRSGDLFGELQGLSIRQCSFHAKAVENSIVGVIHQRDLQTLLWKNGDFCMAFVKWMGHLQRFTQYKLRDLLLYGKIGALASTLIRMVNMYGIQNGKNIHFTTNFTNNELAQMIGSTRETVNRMLRQLNKTEIIDYKQGSIVIKNLDGLKKICHCEECPVEICRL